MSDALKYFFHSGFAESVFNSQLTVRLQAEWPLRWWRQQSRVPSFFSWPVWVRSSADTQPTFMCIQIHSSDTPMLRAHGYTNTHSRAHTRNTGTPLHTDKTRVGMCTEIYSGVDVCIDVHTHRHTHTGDRHTRTHEGTRTVFILRVDPSLMTS